MDPRIARLHARRVQLELDIRAKYETADTEKRELTVEDQGAIDTMDTEIREINGHLTTLIAHEDELRSVDEAFKGLAPVADPLAAVTDARSAVENEIRSFLRGESRAVEIAPESRDLTKGTATAGGNTVPVSFYAQLQEHLIESSAILAAGATVLNTAAGENLEVPVTTAFSTAALTAEAAAIAESDPAFAKRTLGAFKYGVLIQVSRELVDDTVVDLLGFLARQAGRAVGNAYGTDLVVGNGSNKPAGLMSLTTLGVTGGTGVAGVPTADNLIDLFYSVIAPYRNSPDAAWLMNDTTIAKVRKLKDSQGQYLWQPALVLGQPDALLGKPVYTDPNVVATATTAESIAFGDISAYWARIAGGIRFERSDEFAFNTDLVTFKCVLRGDGILVDQTGAVKHFAGGAS